MSNLVPTVITDVNGRTTTVHKRPVSSSPGSKQLPVPSLPDTLQPRLHEPSLVTAEEFEVLLDRAELYTGDNYSHQSEIMSHQNGRDAVSLACHLRGREKLSRDVVSQILSQSILREDVPETYNTLLIAAHLGSTVPLNDRAYVVSLIRSVQGLAINKIQRREALSQFTTEEEVVSNAAVVKFVAQMQTTGIVTESRLRLKDEVAKSRESELRRVQRLRSEGLEELIQSRPEQVDSIIDYVQERGFDHENEDSEVAALCEWLDDPSVMREGTL